MTSTTLDLADPGFLADPYPALARERAAAEVAWHEPTGRWLTFGHATASQVLRQRGLGRVWADLEPADELEPFNLLHRHQMMENEPPEHTRLRRAVASAFARGHVERLRPRVEALAGGLLDEVDPAGFDLVVDYAEPLPVLVIAELLGVPGSWVPDLRRWSQAIVRMYEPGADAVTRAAAVDASRDFADAVRTLTRERRAEPREDLVSHLVSDPGGTLNEDEVVASVVLLLNAGHEASVNAMGNGMVGLLGRGLRPTPGEEATCVEEMLRHDSPLQLFERTATRAVQVGDVLVEEGQRVAALLGAAHRDPAVFVDPDRFDPGRDPNPHLAFGVGLHHCLGSPLARLELTVGLRVLGERLPGLRLAGEPEQRGTFVLRGHTRVPVGA